MKKLIFIFLFLSIAGLADETQNQLQGLYPIQSTLTDEKNQEKISDTGSVLIFTIPGKRPDDPAQLMALTDTHLSFGDSLSIDGIPLQQSGLIKSQLSMNSTDQQLFELDPSKTQGKILPMGYWDPETEEIVLDHDAVQNWQKSNQTLQMALSKNKLDSSFILLGNWARKTGESFSQNPNQVSAHDGVKGDKVLGLSFLPLTEEIFTESTAPEGASGSPLIQIEGIKPIHAPKFSRDGNASLDIGEIINGAMNFSMRYVVRGVVKKASRSFPGTWFSSPAHLALLIKDFQKGKRGVQDEARWHLENWLTYQTFPKGYSEVNLLRNARGNVDRGDGGNLGRSDGGNLGGALRGQWNPDLWNILGITPGLGSKQGPVIGLKLPTGETLYAEDDPGIISESLGLNESKIKPLPLKTDYGLLFLDRFIARNQAQIDLIKSVQDDMAHGRDPLALSIGFRFQQSKLTYDEARKIYIDGLAKELARRTAMGRLAQQAQGNAPFHITLTSETENPSLPSILDPCSDPTQPGAVLEEFMQLTPNRMNFELRGPLPEKEIIRFSLDREGRMLGPNGPMSPFFLPVISVPAAKSHYLIDLTSLFFTDPSRIRSDQWMIRPSEQGNIGRLTQNLVKIAGWEGPILRMKKDSENQVYEIQLGQPISDSTFSVLGEFPCFEGESSALPLPKSITGDLKAIECQTIKR